MIRTPTPPPAEALPTSRDEFARRAVTATAIVALAIVILAGVWAAAHALIVIFAGVLLAILLRGLSGMLSRLTHLSPDISYWITVAALAAILGLGGWFLAAQIATEFDQLGLSLVQYWRRFEAFLGQYTWGQQLIGWFTNSASADGKVDALGRVVAGTLGAFSSLVISVFVALYVGANPQLYSNGLLRLVPLPRRPRAAQILDDMGAALRGWLTGTLINMTIVGAATALGLWWVGIPLPLALGVIAFFLDFVPYLGPILSAVPGVLIALTVGPTEALYAGLVYFAVQSLESYVLSPLVFQSKADLPPAVTMTSQLIGGAFLGVLGIVFATPLTVCAMIFMQRAYVEDALGDDMDEPVMREETPPHRVRGNRRR